MVLAARVIHGSVWALGANVLLKGGQAVVTVVLARLVSPSEFGLMALAAGIVGLLGVVRDVGLEAALIQLRSGVEQAADVALVVLVGVGMLLCVSCWVGAPAAAAWLGKPDTIPIIRALSIDLLLWPWGAVPSILLSRRLAMKELAQLRGIALLAGGGTAVTLAALGCGVRALIAGVLTSSLAYALAAWTRAGRSPRWFWSWSVAWRLLRYGGFGVLESIAGWLTIWSDKLIAGRWLAVHALGIYQMGFRVAMWPTENIVWVLREVLMPAFSHVQSEIGQVRRASLRTIHVLALVTGPIYAVLIAAAEPLTAFVLGPRWSGTAAVVRMLAVLGAAGSIVGIAPFVLKAVGRPEVYPRFFWVRAACSVPAYAWAAQYGVITLCWAHVGLVTVFAPMNLLVFSRVIRAGWRDWWQTLRVPVSGSLLVGLGLAWGLASGPAVRFWNGAEALCILALGGAFYSLWVWTFDRALIGEVFMLLKTGVRSAGAGVSGWGTA